MLCRNNVLLDKYRDLINNLLGLQEDYAESICFIS